MNVFAGGTGIGGKARAFFGVLAAAAALVVGAAGCGSDDGDVTCGPGEAWVLCEKDEDGYEECDGMIFESGGRAIWIDKYGDNWYADPDFAEWKTKGSKLIITYDEDGEWITNEIPFSVSGNKLKLTYSFGPFSYTVTRTKQKGIKYEMDLYKATAKDGAAESAEPQKKPRKRGFRMFFEK